MSCTPTTNRYYVFAAHGRSGYHGWLGRRQEKEREIYQAARIEEISVERITDAENLLVAWDECRREGGAAPGSDGLTYDEFSRIEIAAVLRKVSEAIQEGRYCPYPTRLVRIPKGGGRYRDLRLQGIVDRVVAKAAAEAMIKAFDTIFLPGVMGFRPGRSTWSALVALEHLATTEDRWVLGVADVKDAFPSIPVGRVVEVYRTHIAANPVIELISSILRGDRPETCGLDQGNPLSPLSMNLFLSYCLDRPYSADRTNPPMLRYVDDITIASRGVPEGRRALQHVQGLLHRENLELKDRPRLVNLRRNGARVEILGFLLSKEGNQLKVHLGEEPWQGLDQALGKTYQTPNPTKTAWNIISGWMASFAPALENVQAQDVLRQIRLRAVQKGFRELDGQAALEEGLHRAVRYWQEARERIRASLCQQSLLLLFDATRSARED